MTLTAASPAPPAPARRADAFSCMHQKLRISDTKHAQKNLTGFKFNQSFLRTFVYAEGSAPITNNRVAAPLLPKFQTRAENHKEPTHPETQTSSSLSERLPFGARHRQAEQERSSCSLAHLRCARRGRSLPRWPAAPSRRWILHLRRIGVSTTRTIHQNYSGRFCHIHRSMSASFIPR